MTLLRRLFVVSRQRTAHTTLFPRTLDSFQLGSAALGAPRQKPTLNGGFLDLFNVRFNNYKIVPTLPLAVLPDNLLTSAQQQNAGLGETNEPRVTKPKEFSRGFYDFAHNFTQSKLTRLDSTRYRDWLRSSLPTTLQVSLNQYFRVRWLITQIC